ncbi:hypothetical protein GCM10010345_93110 [Streptomyces canarius]|uniref:Uncharacterized protein n=1 Tax=Streptomyces canarius TaxID=285453 RepID=A0ABQ3DD08_9ACTN|nr:hypothetical protein GCM10010345_93110 [Streptomyces canarius]
MEEGGEADEGFVWVDGLVGGPPFVQDALPGRGEGVSVKSPLLHGSYRVRGVVEDGLGVVGVGEELTHSCEVGGAAGRGQGEEGFQVGGGDARPALVSLGVEVEGQVADGVEADLDGLQLVGVQPELLGLLALEQQEVGEGVDLGAQWAGGGLDAAGAAGCCASFGEVWWRGEVAVGAEEVGERSHEFGCVAVGVCEQCAGVAARGRNDQACGGGDNVCCVDGVTVIGEVCGEVAPPGWCGGHALGPAGGAGDDGVR